jgi:hypothetical protein
MTPATRRARRSSPAGTRRSAAITGLLLLAALTVLGAPATAQDPPAPGLGLGLLEVPSALASDPRAQVYVIDHVNPGATLERRLAVSNGTNEPMRVALYGTAADVANGWVVADGRGGNDLAEWITVEPDEVTVPPRDRVEVTATIRVPWDAGGGERYAAILAEGPPQPGANVAIVPRVGVRVYLSVAGDGPAPVTDFAISTLQAGRSDDGAPFVLIGVDNTGDRAIDVSGELTLTEGPGSLTAGPFPVSLPATIGPGGAGELVVPLDPSLPAGPWRARVELRSGLVVREAEATLSFPESAGSLEPAVEATPIEQQRRVLIPVAGFLLVLTILLLLVVWRRRRRSAEEPEAVDLAG